MCRADIATNARDAPTSIASGNCACCRREFPRDTRQVHTPVHRGTTFNLAARGRRTRGAVSVRRFSPTTRLPARETSGFVMLPLYLATEIFFLFSEGETALKLSGSYHDTVRRFTETRSIVWFYSLCRYRTTGIAKPAEGR